MSIEQYFAKLPKDTPLSLSWKPSPPAPKRQKRGPGRPRKKQPPPTIVTIDDSDKENDPDDTGYSCSSLADELVSIPDLIRAAIASSIPPRSWLPISGMLNSCL